MRSTSTVAKSIDEYLSVPPEKARITLAKPHGIKSVAPKAEELINSQIR